MFRHHLKPNFPKMTFTAVFFFIIFFLVFSLQRCSRKICGYPECAVPSYCGYQTFLALLMIIFTSTFYVGYSYFEYKRK